MDRYLRSVHRFLFRYHADLKQLDTEHFESFYDFLCRKQYHPAQIDDYMTSLSIFSVILDKKIETKCFTIRKKLHHKDEVLSK